MTTSPGIMWQPSLFGVGGSPDIDRSFSGLVRIELDRSCWVDHASGWISGADVLFAERLGVTSQVLDIHDGELMPTLENRRTITRLIREWDADIVISHRPWDYHPDHRYTGVLVQDAAYMVGVPNIASDTPPLERNPVFFYLSDRFQKPYPFVPDVTIGIDSHIDVKVAARHWALSSSTNSVANSSRPSRASYSGRGRTACFPRPSSNRRARLPETGSRS
jgi:hypothetical protein